MSVFQWVMAGAIVWGLLVVGIVEVFRAVGEDDE